MNCNFLHYNKATLKLQHKYKIIDVKIKRYLYGQHNFLYQTAGRQCSKQLTAIQMRSVKGHLYNNPYYEWEEDKQRYRLGDGLYMRFGANNDQSVYWDIVREKDEDGEYEELDFYGYSDPESSIRDLMREWDLHSYDPAQQFSVRSVTLQAMVDLDTEMDLSW